MGASCHPCLRINEDTIQYHTIAFPFAFHPSVFLLFTLLHLPLDFIRVSSLRPMYLHPSVDPSLTHFFCEFPGLVAYWLWNPMLRSQRRSRCAHGAEISFQISALHGRGLNLGPCSLMAANVTTRLRRTPQSAQSEVS